MLRRFSFFLTALAVGMDATTLRADEAFRLMAPFAAQRANFFHAALGIPRLQAAWTLDTGQHTVRFRTDHSHNTKGHPLGGSIVQARIRAGLPVENNFLGQFNTWLAVEYARGLLPGLEAGFRLGYGGWDEQQDHFYFFDREGRPLIRYEDRDVYGLGPTGRDDDLTDVVFHATMRLSQSDNRSRTFAITTQMKLPLGAPRNLTDAGTTDAAFAFLYTEIFGHVALHINAGGMVPIGKQNLFIPDADVTLRPVACGGVGLMYRGGRLWAFGLQLEGNTSAFRDVPFLAASPVTVLVGARRLAGRWSIEAGLGTGLDWQAAYDHSYFLALSRLL